MKKCKNNKKGRFSRAIVIFCISEMAIMQVWGMSIADKDHYVSTELVNANHIVFGGELLMLCPKRLFSKDREDEKVEKLTSINDIVWELAHRGIITDKDLWLKKLEKDNNAFWLVRKIVRYLIEKNV